MLQVTWFSVTTRSKLVNFFDHQAFAGCHHQERCFATRQANGQWGSQLCRFQLKEINQFITAIYIPSIIVRNLLYMYESGIISKLIHK